MKRKALLLLVGLCLTGLILMCFQSTVDRKAKLVETARAINVLNKDMVKTLGEKPTIESVSHAHMLLEQQGPSIKEKIKELIDAGRLKKNSDERIELEEIIGQRVGEFVDYYEKFARVGRDDLENLNNLKSQYIAADFGGKPTRDLRTGILQKTEQIKANYDVIVGMESLMTELKSIYTEIKRGDQENV